MRMLVACEFSGTVRDAFTARGWDAWSCDLLPSETPGQHIQGDALAALRSRSWDLVIAHPPCTYLANSGVRWLSNGRELNPERHGLMKDGCDFLQHSGFVTRRVYVSKIQSCTDTPVTI